MERLRAGEPIEALTGELLGRLTTQEKLGLLDGDTPFWEGLAEIRVNGYNRTPIPMGRVERLGIPGLLFSDGPRGVVMGRSTAFPVSMARGATWDRELEERVGAAIGLEGRAQGANFFGGVCINLPRHPAWGRVQETYGEDPLLLGEMGAALVRGVGPNMMAVAKHYALNSMENARFKVDVMADDATLHEVYLAHFRRVVDEGVDGIMTVYNSVNSGWAGKNERLLEGVLRGEWGFEGVTVSDFIWGLHDSGQVPPGRPRRRGALRGSSWPSICPRRSPTVAPRPSTSTAPPAASSAPSCASRRGAWRPSRRRPSSSPGHIGRWPAGWPAGPWRCCRTTPSKGGASCPSRARS